MADVTKTTQSAFLKEVWSNKVSVIYATNVVLANLMDRRWEPEISVGKGDLVNIAPFTKATSASKRSTFGTGASITFVAPTETQIQLAIDQMAYRAYRVPVEISAQQMAQWDTMMVADIGEAIAI